MQIEDLKLEIGRNTKVNMENTRRKCGNSTWSMRKRMGKWGKHARNCQQTDFSATESTVFRRLHRLPDSLIWNNCRTCLLSKSVYSSPHFPWYYPRVALHAKFILMVVVGECRSVIVVLSSHGKSATRA